jgi:tetratricopeptide (TPR) repeat protein
MSRTLILFALVSLIAAARPAHAWPIDDAKAAFAAGKAAFERGDYETALQQFERANSIAPAPSLSYNIGATYERLGRWADAAAAFDRYLEQAGAPQSDDEKQFQDNLRARADADRKRAPSAPAAAPTAAPLPPPVMAPPPTNYYPPQPYAAPYYVPPPPPSREERLAKFKAQRGRAIALVVIGGVLTVTGLGVLLDGVLNPHQESFSSFQTSYNTLNYVEDWLGATFIVVGATLWIPGAVSWSSSQHQILELSKPDKDKGIGAPHAYILSSPVFRF